MERGESCRVLIRNYRPDGTLFWNEIACSRCASGKGRSRIGSATTAMAQRPDEDAADAPAAGPADR